MNEQNVGAEGVVKRRYFLTPAQRAEWVRRFVESGQSVAQFCDEQGLVPVTLHRWLAKSGQAKSVIAAEPVPAFTEIKLSPSQASLQWVAELSRPNGVVLRVARDLPTELLEQLLRVC
jgi:hypothetical protein